MAVVVTAPAPGNTHFSVQAALPDRRQASLFVSDDYFSLFLPRGECYRMMIS